jgi:hypothetical protein
MLVPWRSGIKTMEDLADCATDDLGWTEANESVHKGAFSGSEVSAVRS